MAGELRAQETKIGVVIATTRPALLLGRALPSVRAQTRLPDLVVVVVDAAGDICKDVADRVRASDPDVLVLGNRRTPRRSGMGWAPRGGGSSGRCLSRWGRPARAGRSNRPHGATRIGARLVSTLTPAASSLRSHFGTLRASASVAHS